MTLYYICMWCEDSDYLYLDDCDICILEFLDRDHASVEEQKHDVRVRGDDGFDQLRLHPWEPDIHAVVCLALDRTADAHGQHGHVCCLRRRDRRRNVRLGNK